MAPSTFIKFPESFSGFNFQRAFCCLVAFTLVCCVLFANLAYSAEVSAVAGKSGLSLQGPSSSEATTPQQYVDRGALSFRRGSFDDAKSNYEAALQLYEKQLNRTWQCETLIRLSQTDHMTGQYEKALKRLNKALAIAREINDRHRLAAALGSVGNVYIGLGKKELAEKYLNEGLSIAKDAGYVDVTAVILNNKGNLSLSQNQYPEALDAYRGSAAQADRAGNFSLAAMATVNGATAEIRSGAYTDARLRLEGVMDKLRLLEDSYAKAYGLINAGLAFSDLRIHLTGQNESLLKQAHAALNEALIVAQRLGDQRTLSYACGYLGGLHEQESQYQEALELTRRAILAAQQKNATEALYRWNWQSGRILSRLGKIDGAIVAYRNSMQDLQTIREEFASCYANPEASYRKTASTVCLELVNLLLQRASMHPSRGGVDPYLAEARETLEVLKIFELREYFKDDCIDAARFAETKLDVVSEKAVVIYPILLGDRMELLVSFPGLLKRYTLPVGVDTLTKEIREFRRMLEKRTTGEFLPHARQLYNWIIRPLEKDLQSVPLCTLVFVPDGPLRTIPMAALHDGNQFLIHRYPIAITPGLNLTDPRPMKREKARILALGLTESVQGFPGLPYVSNELKAIKGLYEGRYLLNEEFRVASVEKALRQEPFSMVHIASHSQFGEDVNKTFLLAFDGQFTMNQFGEYVGLLKFRDEPLELLTLSACETAAGDDRAALGLAGVAVRAGARSAIATLWHVNDPASYELIAEFYKQLHHPATSRAEALQAAQVKLLRDQRYDHPGYWAPFLLINNWL